MKIKLKAKPIYSIESSRYLLINGDNRDKEVSYIMEEWIEVYGGRNYEIPVVHSIVTDPQYNLSNFTEGDIKFRNRKDMKYKFGEWDEGKELNFKYYASIFRDWVSENGTVYIFCGHNQIGRWYEELEENFDRTFFLAWHKLNPAPMVRKSSYLHSVELIIGAWNKGHTFNFGKQNEMHNFIETPICMGKERKAWGHPTQKPVEVIRKLILTGSNKGEIIFDPFAGVGSVGVAAIREGRKFIGIEKDRKWFRKMVERIKNENITRRNKRIS